MPSTVCYCFGVTREEIRAVIREYNCRTPEDIGQHCKAGRGCHSCVFDLEDLLCEWRREQRRAERSQQQLRS